MFRYSGFEWLIAVGLTLAAGLSTLVVAPREASAQCIAEFTVNTNADAPDASPGNGVCADSLNRCTFRAAIEEANRTGCAATTINFSIGSGYRRIDVTQGPLETITGRTVTIDGYTQPGSSPNTASLLEPGNGLPLIEVRGIGEPTQLGLSFSCLDGETRAHVVRGLILNGFDFASIINSGCDGAQFLGNYIGVTASGDALGSTSPVVHVYILNASDNRVGSISAGDRNVIAGASVYNVVLVGDQASTNNAFRVADNLIYNNFIGVNEAGDAGLGGVESITDAGIALLGPGVTPGTTDSTPLTPHPEANEILYNVVGGNSGPGILTGGAAGSPSQYTWIAANIIGHGTQATDFLLGGGTQSPPAPVASLSNGGSGIQLGSATDDAPSAVDYVQLNVVTQSVNGIDLDLGPAASEFFPSISSSILLDNLVLDNGNAGVRTTTLAGFSSNRVWDNGGLGILSEVAGTEALPWITLSGPTNNVIQGSLDQPFTIPAGLNIVCVRANVQVFASDSCDPSGSGEGRELVQEFEAPGCTSNFQFSVDPLPYPRPYLTATASWTLGQNVGAGTVEFNPVTSDFSNCVSNSPPVVLNPIPNQSATEEVAFSYAVPSTTFSDPDGDSFSYSASLADGTPLSETWLSFGLSLRAWRFTGTPQNSDVGTWSVQLCATDTSGPATTCDVFDIDVQDVNDPPVARNDNASTNENTAISVSPGVLANDTDPDLTNDTLSVSAFDDTSTEGAAVSVLSDGRYSYDPRGADDLQALPVGGSATDTFTYTVSDGRGGTDSATVSITVAGRNDAPVAVNDSASVNEDGAVDITVLSNDFDVDNGDEFGVTNVGTPSHGSAVVEAGDVIVYTPTANYFGPDSFTYRVTDGSGANDTATVSITVDNVPDTPVARDDTATTAEETEVVIDVLDNDSDVDGDTLTVANVEDPSHGAVTTDGVTVTYTPELDYFGPDSFTYTVTDPLGLAAVATVDVTVTNVPDSPAAVDDAAVTDEETPITLDVLANDTDADGDDLEVDSVVQPAGGGVIIEADGRVTYTPDTDFNGIDTFDYVVTDPGGLTDSATVSIDVQPVNDPPSLTGLGAVGTDEDIDVTVDFTIVDPDSDVGSVVVTVTSSDQTIVADDDLVVTGTGADRQLTIDPQPNANGGPVTLTLTASDGDDTTVVTFELTVTAVNDQPTISDIGNALTPEDTSSDPIPFTIGDVETDAGALEVTATSSDQAIVADADISLGGTGANRTITLTPQATVSGSTTITVTVSDGDLTAVDTFVLTVLSVADAPNISAIDDQTTDEDITLGPIAFTVSDEDTDSDALDVTASSSDQTILPNANLVLGGAAGDRTLTLTPAADRNGTVTVTVQVTDGLGSDETSFALTVVAVNDAPVLTTPGPQSLEEDGALVFSAIEGNAISLSDLDAGSADLVLDLSVDNGLLALATTDGVSVVTGEPDGAVSFTLSGPQASLRAALNGLEYAPDADFSGADTLSLTLDDGGATGTGGAGTAEAAVAIDVAPVNDAPEIAAPADLTIDEDTPSGALAFTVSDRDDADGGLAVSATSSDPAVVPDANLTLGGADGTRTIEIVPADDAFGGPVTITLTVSDGDLEASATFQVTVDPVNDPPTISDIADQNLPEDGTTGALTFTIDDLDDDPLLLEVTASSSNEALVAPSGLVLGGLGNSRTIDVRPLPNASGTSTVTVTVGDGELTTSTSFDVTVAGENDVPTIAAIGDVTTDEDVATDSIALTLDDIDDPVGDLTVSVDVDDEALVPVEGVAVSGTGAERTLVLTPALNANGSTVVTVTVSDGTDSSSTSFTLTVTAVNDEPTVGALDDATISEDTDTGEISVAVGDVETAADDLVVSVASSNEGLLSPDGIALGGGGAARTLTLTPLPNQNGSTTLTVTVSDGDLSAEASFDLTVTPVNDPPTISAIDDQTTDEDTPTEALSFTVLDIETEAGDLAVTVESSDAELLPEAGLELSGDGSDRTLTLTPADQLSGTATVTLTVSDGELAAETSFDLEVIGVNDAPVAVGDAYEMLQTDLSLDVPAPGVLGNDTDVEGSTLTPSLIDDVESGALTLGTDGSFSFVPATVAFAGDVTFTYQADDGQAVSNTATVTLTVTFVDSDDDGVGDTVDNCIIDPNGDQGDIDDDDVGDACDDDADGDGVTADNDCDDTNPAIAQVVTYYADNDEDGFGDGDSTIMLCEPTPPTGYVDNPDDNCPETANPDQADTDEDGIGDACEDDTDGDGILDDGDGSGDPSDNPCVDGQTENCDDNCRITQNPDQADFDNNGEGDECADDIDGDNVFNFEDECVRTPGVPEFLGCPEEDLGAKGCACSSTLALDPRSLGGSLLLVAVVGVALLWPRRRRSGRD